MVFTHSALTACVQPLLVRSLQLVEVRPYAEEEASALSIRRFYLPFTCCHIRTSAYYP